MISDSFAGFILSFVVVVRNVYVRFVYIQYLNNDCKFTFIDKISLLIFD